ncbi:MAG: hypothetical protein GF308_20945 [Candidatus Heimdallarchaeota archaeon]|nr:hypothetical protein [Candidatus Heimdallarchaeota archaeon]
MSNLKKREYLLLPLDLCFFDRGRYDKMHSERLPKIISYRKFPNELFRVHFATKNIKGEDKQETHHLLWIQVVEIQETSYVKFSCDCKYFKYRQIRPAKGLFGVQKIDNDLCVVVKPESFAQNERLFNIDKHAFLALQRLFNIQVQISI